MLTGQSMSFISIPSLAPTPGRQSFTLSDFHSSLSKLLHCWGRLTRSLSVRHLVCDNISSNWTMYCIALYVTMYGDIWRDLGATRKSFILGLSEKGRLWNILQLPTLAFSTFFFW